MSDDADEKGGKGGPARAERFDALYRGDIDPWRFRTSDYERDKYAATLATLPRARYRRALEIGCSIGELTRRLGERADRVLGLDVSAIAIAEARRTHAHAPGLRFEVLEVPRRWPDGRFDLVVLSEVLYFLEPDEIDALALRVTEALVPGGHCLCVCWTGENDSTLDGDAAAERFVDGFAGAGAVTLARRAPGYRLDLLERSA